MAVAALPRKRPVPSIASAAFVVALLITGAYFAGVVPGIPKTLPTFVDMLTVTVGLFVIAAVAWVGSFITR